MNTFLNKPIKDSTLGILYLCDYKYPTIEVVREIEFDNPREALDAYANTGNPESQLAMGNTKEAFEKELTALHNRLNNPKWVADLKDYL